MLYKVSTSLRPILGPPITYGDLGQHINFNASDLLGQLQVGSLEWPIKSLELDRLNSAWPAQLDNMRQVCRPECLACQLGLLRSPSLYGSVSSIFSLFWSMASLAPQASAWSVLLAYAPDTMTSHRSAWPTLGANTWRIRHLRASSTRLLCSLGWSTTGPILSHT